MRQVRAFTIVEFTIAVAVAAILGAAAISRYNSYLRTESFRGGAREIANCVQRAHQQARTGAVVNPPRFVRATIKGNPDSSQVECWIESHTQTFEGSLLTTSLLLTGVPAEGAASQLFRADNTALHNATTVRIVFGALENGMPLGWSSDGNIIRQPDNPGEITTYVPFGTGFSMSAANDTVRLNNVAASGCGVLTMTPTGTPVEFAELASCS